MNVDGAEEVAERMVDCEAPRSSSTAWKNVIVALAILVALVIICLVIGNMGNI